MIRLLGHFTDDDEAVVFSRVVSTADPHEASGALLSEERDQDVPSHISRCGTPGVADHALSSSVDNGSLRVVLSECDQLLRCQPGTFPLPQPAV